MNLAMAALLSLSAVAATCAVYASDGRPGPRGPGARGLRTALTRGLRAAAAGTLFALPLCYAYSIVSQRTVGAAPSLAQIGIALVPVSVFLSQLMQSYVQPNGRTRRRIVIIGDPAARSRIASQREIAHDIVGFFELSADHPLVGGPQPAAESARRLQQFLEKAKPDAVVVACADRKGDPRDAAALPVWELLRVKASGLPVVDFATFWELETGRIDLQSLHPEWLLFGPDLRGSAGFLFCKRVFDVLFAGLMLALTLWLFAVMAALVKATSPGPAIYRQERVGLNGKTFTILKFRSMYVDAERASGPMWAQPNDPRITLVGSFLRKTRLDELPQLWNVLKGEMSLVGPRPEQVQFVEILSRALPFYRLRLAMKPGLTGWAMVNTGYAASLDEHADRLSYDLFYMRHASIVFDLFILARTLRVVVKRLGR